MQYIAIVALIVLIVLLMWLFDPAQRRSRALIARPVISDEEFTAKHDPIDEINCKIALKVRNLFAEHTGYPAVKLLPDDDFLLYMADMDFTPLILELESTFAITLTDDECVKTLCTIRAVTALIVSKIGAS